MPRLKGKARKLLRQERAEQARVRAGERELRLTQRAAALDTVEVVYPAGDAWVPAPLAEAALREAFVNLKGECARLVAGAPPVPAASTLGRIREAVGGDEPEAAAHEMAKARGDVVASSAIRILLTEPAPVPGRAPENDERAARDERDVLTWTTLTQVANMRSLYMVAKRRGLGAAAEREAAAQGISTGLAWPDMYRLLRKEALATADAARRLGIRPIYAHEDPLVASVDELTHLRILNAAVTLYWLPDRPVPPRRPRIIEEPGAPAG